MEVRVENRNPEMNEGPTREAVQQLASMFPNVPLGVIRNEMVRAGSMQPAIERLLALSSTYPVRVPERPPRNPTPSIHKVWSPWTRGHHDLHPAGRIPCKASHSSLSPKALRRLYASIRRPGARILVCASVFSSRRSKKCC